MAIVLEVREKPVEAGGCSQLDRRTFRRRTLGRLAEEFGDRLEVIWEEPPASAPTLPTIIVAGRVIHEGGYLPWEIVRPIVAHALAVEAGVQEFEESTKAQLSMLGIDAEDWQQGLLEWLARDEDDRA
jgi:hypothetical protein